jgi:DivIVA domain-containing protein
VLELAATQAALAMPTRIGVQVIKIRISSQAEDATMSVSNNENTLPDGIEMPLTPDEVVTKRFPSAFRGYAKWEVDEFLKDIALDYQRALGLAEWAMQRAAALSGDKPGPELTAGTAEASASDGTAAPFLPPPAPNAVHEISAEATPSDSPVDMQQLAILINNINLRLESLESMQQYAAAQTAARNGRPVIETPVRPGLGRDELQGVTTDSPAPRVRSAIQDAPEPAAGGASMSSSADWWPTESPLWVVTREKSGPTAS